jgi:hypothetical protein
MQSVTVRLTGPEASDYLNFVVKEVETNTWYDLDGTNFQVPLRVAPPPPPPEAKVNGKGKAQAPELPPLLPLDQIPQLPQVRDGT